MVYTNKWKKNLKMKESIIILVLVIVLSQFGDAASTIENVSSITGKTELPKPEVPANTFKSKDDVKEKTKPVVLLVPVESSEEIYDSNDEYEGGEEQDEESTEDITYHNHKTKRCKSPNSFRTGRRLSLARDSRKYISASTVSSIDKNVESPIGGTSLFRVASVKDAKKILKNLLKSRSAKQEDDASLERVSKPQKQDSIRFVSKDSERQGYKPTKYVCYCVEADCGMKRPGKKPSRTYAAKKKVKPNGLSKSSTNYEDQKIIEGPGFFLSEGVLGTPNNLHCPPGAILIGEPEYLAQLAMKRNKQNDRLHLVKDNPETICPNDSEAPSLGQPTKINIPLLGNRKWNQRIYKVDRISPFGQKLQSVFEHKENRDSIPCHESKTTSSAPQSLQDYYNNEQSNYNQYDQVPVVPNIAYRDPYNIYPQFPQYLPYDDGLHDPIDMAPPNQDFVSHQEPLNNQYVPTPLGKNFIDIDQCIKIFGPNFCVVTSTSISPILGPPYVSNDENELKEPGMVTQWQERTHYTTKIPQQKASKYPTSVYNANEATDYYHPLGITQNPKENLHEGEDYPEDDTDQLYESRTSSGSEYDRVTTSPYYTGLITLKMKANDATSHRPNYKTIDSKHKNHDYGDYGNSFDPESASRDGHTNSVYLVPEEDSYYTESPDYLGSSEEAVVNTISQKISEEHVTEGPVIAVMKNLQGAHRIASPEYVQYTVKPVENVSTFSSENASDETFKDISKYIQATHDYRLSDYHKSEFRYPTSKPSNEKSIESSTELPFDLVFSTIDRPEDKSRMTILKESARKDKIPSWQRITTMYPIFNNEDRTTSTSIQVHDSNHQGNLYPFTVTDQTRTNFEQDIPKTSPHQPFVRILESSPDNYLLEPEFISSSTIDGNNNYASLHAAEDKAEDSTTPLPATNEPHESTYTSTIYLKMNNAEQIKTSESSLQEPEENKENANENIPKTRYYTTKSNLGDTVHKYSTTKLHSYLQSKQPESNSDSVAAKTTTSYDKLLERSQSTPTVNFAKPELVLSMTVDGDDQYTTSHAVTVDSNHGTTALLRANEPEEQKLSSSSYFNTDAGEMEHDSSEYEETSVKTPSTLYTSELKNGGNENRNYIPLQRTSYPQREFLQTTFFDGSTDPEQVGDSFVTRKISSHQPFVESITRSPSTNSFEQADDIANRPTSYVTVDDSNYSSTVLLKANEPENPSTVDYITHSEMTGVDQNRWTKPEEVTNPHQQFVGIRQSTPVNNFSQSETSYATMEDTNDSEKTELGAKEPEDEVFSLTNGSLLKEDKEKHQNNIEKTTWTQYYPTQSEIQKPSVGQHFTTDQYSHPQFVESYQSTLVDSSTQQDQLEEDSGALKTRTDQTFEENIGHSTSSNDFPKTESISDAAIFYATMAISKYDATPSLGAIEPKERELTSYTRYPTTIDTGGDVTVPLWQQETEQDDENNTEKIPSSDYYVTQSDQNEWSKAGKTTSPHRQLVGITQPTPVDNFSQFAEASSATLGGKNDYTTSYATMEDADDSQKTELGAKEPEDEVFSPTNDSWPRKSKAKHQDNIEKTTWTQYYPTQSEIQKPSVAQHFTTDQYSHPQFVESYQSTLVDSSTHQDQPEEDSRALKTRTDQTFEENIGHSTSSNDFPKTKSISDAANFYATMANSKYDATPSLGAIEPKEREITSYTDYPTTIDTGGDVTVPLWQQETEQDDENNTEKIPSSDYYVTQSDQNEWSKAGKTTIPHRQLVGITQPTPVDNFSQFAEASSATLGGKNDYTTSYATMEDADDSKKTELGAKEPEDEVFSPTNDSWPRENKAKHQDSIEKTTWTQYYPTQSEIKKPSVVQHFTTDQYSHPQFVESYQSTLVDSSAHQDQPEEDSGALKTRTDQTFEENIGHSTSANDFPKTKSISDAAIFYATMANSKYDATPSLGAIEPEERELTSYSGYATTIDTGEDITVPLWRQETEEDDENNTKKISLSDFYVTQSDQNEWSKAGKPTIPHRQYVGVTQSTPMDDVLQREDTSTVKYGPKNDYTTSYVTMEKMDQPTANLLGEKEPEEHVSRYTIYPTIREQHQDNLRKPTWSQNYPTESRMENSNVHQHLTTEKNSSPQFVGLRQSALADGSTSLDAAISIATMKGSTYDTTPSLGETELEEPAFNSHQPYPTTIGTERDTVTNMSSKKIAAPTYYTTQVEIADMDENKWSTSGISTSPRHQFVGITQSAPSSNFPKSKGNIKTADYYASIPNSKYDTTPLLGVTEPVEVVTASSTSYPKKIEADGAISVSSRLQNAEERDESSTEIVPSTLRYSKYSEITALNHNKRTKTGKTKSSRPQFIGKTQSTPANGFSQPDVTSNSEIGGNIHDQTDLKYDTTPLLGATEPEEQDLTSYWKSRDLTSSYPQLEGITPSTPVNDFSEYGFVSSTTTRSNNHYPTTYSTMEDLDHSTISVLGEKEIGDGIFRPTTYPTDYDAEQMTPVSLWQQENTKNYQNNLGEPSWTPYYPPRSKVQYATSGRYFPTEQNTYPENVKSYQLTNDVTSSTVFNTQQYSTMEVNSQSQLGTETPDVVTVDNNDKQLPSWYYSTAQQKAPNQNTRTPFVASQHSTILPKFEPDLGGKEKTNAYFTSKAYDDNINPVAGPDSYFEGKGLKNWNDFTSISSNDFPIGDTNRAQDVKEQMTVDLLVPDMKGWETTQIIPLLSTDNEVVGEENPHKESPRINQFNQEKAEGVLSRQTTQGTSNQAHILYPVESYGNALSTSSGRTTGEEDVTKSISEAVVISPIKDTHFFESPSAESKILKSENKILKTTTMGSYGIDFTATSEKPTFSKEKITPDEPAEKALKFDEKTAPAADYNYTDECSTVDEPMTTIFSKYQDDATPQHPKSRLAVEPILNQKATPSNKNYGDYISSEELHPKNSEFVAISNSKTVGNSSKVSTTPKLEKNREGDRDSSSSQEFEQYPNHDISSVNQLSSEDRNILRTTVEKVVNDLISAKSDEHDEDGDIPPEVAGAPLRPGLPKMSILKNVFSLPEVKNMVSGTAKALMSGISGVPQASSLGRLADHVIDSVLDGVVNNIQSGPIPTDSPAIINEHRYKNGRWDVVPVTLDLNVDGVDKKPVDKVLSTMQDIVGRPGIGLHGARLPVVQNIIVRAVENTLKKAKHIVNNSVIWDTLNNIIAQAEISVPPTLGTTTVKATSMSTVKTNPKATDVQTTGGPVKIAPVIPVTAHVFKDGKRVDKQTVVGGKKKNLAPTTPTKFPTGHRLHTSSSSYETLAELDNQYNNMLKAMDYALLGESEENGETPEYTSTTSFVEINKEIPKNVKTLHNDEDGLDNSPIKYYSPNDRILSYIKNHQTPPGFVGSQKKLQPTSGSFNTAPTENLSTLSKTAPNELTELVSTESSEFPSTIYHLDFDQDGSNDYTTEEYIPNENPSVTEELVRNTAGKPQENYGEVETSAITADSIESTSIPNTKNPTKNVQNQITPTTLYVYGEPVGRTQSSEGTSKNDEQLVDSADKAFIGGANIMTTEKIDQTPDKVEPSDKIVDLNETLTVPAVGEKNLGTDTHKCNDQGITTTYVYGTPVNELDPRKTTDLDESTAQNLQQILETSNHHDFSHDTTASIMTGSQDKIEHTQFPGFQPIESYSNEKSDGQPDKNNPDKYVKMVKALVTDNSARNFEDEVSTESSMSNKSFFDPISEGPRVSSKNVDNDFLSQVHTNGEPIQETTTQLSRKQPKMLKSYVSVQEGTTSSEGLIGAAGSRSGKPGVSSLPPKGLNHPQSNILEGSRKASGSASSWMTPKYDPTYFGKISLNGVNPGDGSISNLMSSDLFYVGDGVKIPLTIQRMPDGSFALSLSEKICENFVNRKCPCCVPREGDIVEEKRQSNEPEEYSVERSSKENYNYESFEPTESAEYQRNSKKRYVRSTSGSEVVVTSATPVKKFINKYNLTLNLAKNHSPTSIQSNDKDAEEIRNSRRKPRLSFPRDTKLGNLYGNNNEIQRDDSEEIENPTVDAYDSDTSLKQINSIRTAEYIFDTNTNHFIQSLSHIKDAPEDKRTEIVLNALDGLVNAERNPDSMVRYNFGNVDQGISSENQNPWVESDEYDLNEMENEMVRYGYQKDNPILERIRFIKAKQNSHGQYKYQKNIDDRAKGKMNILKTVLQWLREVFLETKANNESFDLTT